MKPLDITAVLLFCLVAHGSGRPSDADEHGEILREAKKDKHYQQYLVERRGFPNSGLGGDEVQAVPFYGSDKGKYQVIHPSARTTVEDHNPMLDGLWDEDEEKSEQMNDGDSSSPSEEPPNESVSVNLPPDNASVAEAKPVGLAIAGVGGVASSKPVATAVVGPGGLALAKPVATAIAGIPGAEALVGVASNVAKQKSKVSAVAATTSQPSKKTVPVTGVKTKRTVGLSAPDDGVAMISPTFPPSQGGY